MKDMYDNKQSNADAYIDVDLKGIAELSKGIYDVEADSFAFKAKSKKVSHPMFRGVTKKELKRGIIFSEILGKPKAW